MRVPEQYRVEGDITYGNNGVFIIPHNKIIGYYYTCIASDGLGWEHVSISLQDTRSKKTKPVKRCATWSEMCFVKSLFWDDEESVMQIHAPKSEWVSTHPYCLHLWRPMNYEFKRPPAELVGFKGDNIQSF